MNQHLFDSHDPDPHCSGTVFKLLRL